MLYRDCETCGGEGKINNIDIYRSLPSKCPDCKGRGVVPVEMAKNVKALARELLNEGIGIDDKEAAEIAVHGKASDEGEKRVIDWAAKIAAFVAERKV